MENTTNGPQIPTPEILAIKTEPQDELIEAYWNSSIADGWNVGHLAWARAGKWPFWPGLICSSPAGPFIDVISGTKPQVRFHVRFLAYKGQRSWIPSSNVMPFTTIEDFEAMKRDLLSKIKAKDGRAQAFRVSNTSKLLWQQAVVEAQMLATVPVERRIFFFEQNLAVEKSIQQQRSTSIKRLSIDSQDTWDEVISEIDRRITSTCNKQIYQTSDLLLEQPDMLDPMKCEPTSFNPFIISDEFEHDLKMRVPNENALDTHTTVAGQLLIMENDLSFQEYFTKTKECALRDICNSSYEMYLKNLSLKMWLLHGMNDSQKKPILRNRPSTTIDSDFNMNLEQTQRSKKKRNLRKTSALTMNEVEPIAKKIKLELDSSNKCNAVNEVVQEETKVAMTVSKLVRHLVKEERDLEEISKYLMKEKHKNILFKGLKKELVCRICHQTGDIVKCDTSSCNEYVHRKCAIGSTSGDMLNIHSEDMNNNNMFTGDGDWLDDGKTDEIHRELAYCPDCYCEERQVCFVCKTNNGNELRCTEKKCSRLFHLKCLQYWPQHKNVIKNKLICPSHVCQTCTSDDPKAIHHRTTNSLIKCVNCPATFHIDSSCIPAGSILLTSTQLICPRHRVENRKRVNANWCFLCSEMGGTLIRCTTCPTAFHARCLQLSVIDDPYICEECESGRFPLYGEAVWAKMGNCKWWPAVIVPPTEIPPTVLAVKRQPHNFAVRYFGTHNYSWISRGFVFLYQEGDSEYHPDSVQDKIYRKSLDEAKDYAKQLRIINERFFDSNSVRPPPYIKIKTNRPVHPVRIENNDRDSNKDCGCTPQDDNPCGQYSQCMNQLLLMECHPATCPAGAQCQNQRFEKRIYANVEERRTQGKGWGLFAVDHISAGSFIIEYVGELINRAELKRRIEDMQRAQDEHYYFCTLSGNVVIDSRHQGNLSRFTNHSCEPNSKTQCWSVKGNTRIGLFSLVDIPANTELTFNYQLESNGVFKKVCHCGTKRCAGFIGATYVDPEKKSKLEKGRNGRKR